MELPTIAAPGVGERADAVADAACHLYDTVAPWRTGSPGGWSRTAAEDAAEAIETTAHALAHIDPGAEVVLAPVHAALADLRRRLGLAPADPLNAAGLPATPRTVGNPRRTRWVRVLTPPSPRQPPSRTTS
ncbi:hypothetical protein J7E99_16890 [Streptomyces sp. ISL-44]|uniref:hypothetical protein n=1 Tax=unclassified Streptomyces TaxID=2593676 RepID=UPI001BED199A|nr:MULTISPECIES: hypothetical protein [unclassified Streptomyces]MBT2542344.1 hypothetical protein [Streptomyces sp. ISL-44]MCX5010078.1 hypothetical protein [Streptomyces sp. NBC_00555]